MLYLRIMGSDVINRTVAAIDLGSQTFRIAVAGTSGHHAKILTSELRNVRLGRDLGKTGLLSDEAIERGVAVLSDFKTILAKWRVDKIRACGTAALRHARNAQDFIQRARILGYEVEILSADEEANLAARGVRATLPDIATPSLIIDAGGGSTEFLLARRRDILYSSSLDIGAVWLTERFLENDPPSDEETTALCRCVDGSILRMKLELPLFPKSLVGVGGTATSLAAVLLGLEHYQPEKIRGSTLSLNELRKLWKRWKGTTIQQRRKIPGLEPERADIILAGLAIFLRVLHLLGHSELMISDGGLLSGILLSVLKKESNRHAARLDTHGLYI